MIIYLNNNIQSNYIIIDYLVKYIFYLWDLVLIKIMMLYISYQKYSI